MDPSLCAPPSVPTPVPRLTLLSRGLRSLPLAAYPTRCCSRQSQAVRVACWPCHAIGDRQRSPSRVTVGLDPRHMPQAEDATYACSRHSWRQTYLSIPPTLAHCKRLSRPLVPRANIAKVKVKHPRTGHPSAYQGCARTLNTAGVVWSDNIHPTDQQPAVRWCFQCVCFRARQSRWLAARMAAGDRWVLHVVVGACCLPIRMPVW
jgi:hypothetical protein